MQTLLLKMLPAFFLLVVATQGSTAKAATDGTLGATSTGSLVVTITVPPLLRVTGLADRALGTWNGSSDMNSNDDVCIYSNVTSGSYKVTATGTGTGGAFTLANGGSALPYKVFWNDVTGTTGEVELTAGTALTGQTGYNNTSQTCGGGSNADFHIRILATELSNVPSGAYTGNVSFLIENN